MVEEGEVVVINEAEEEGGVALMVVEGEVDARMGEETNNNNNNKTD